MVPSFRCAFLPGMPSSLTPGSPTSICSRLSMPTWPSPFDHRLGTPNTPAIRFARAAHFVASLVRFRCGLPGCLPPCTDRTGTPQPSGTFTSRLSTGSVSLPVAGYDYNSDWTPLLAGLSPAGMAASFAARSKRAEKPCLLRRQLSLKAAVAAHSQDRAEYCPSKVRQAAPRGAVRRAVWVTTPGASLHPASTARMSEYRRAMSSAAALADLTGPPDS